MSNTLVQFYHLTTSPIERALPRLLEKAYGAGYRSLLVAGSAEQAEYFNQLLWTYDPNSFLPHGTAQDGSTDQPIFIGTAETLAAENHFTLAVITEGTAVESPNFTRVLDIFNGNDEASVASARERWKRYKDEGRKLSYMQQTPQGGWEEKAAA